MAAPYGENGGFLASTFYLFVPTTTVAGQAGIFIFDSTTFDDPTDGSSYSYRAEDISIVRVPTVRRVALVYTDLGLATINVTLSGVNDNNNIVTASGKFSIGTSGATQAECTILADVTLTAYRPQLTVSRAAGGGPVSIVSATLIGEIEEVTL